VAKQDDWLTVKEAAERHFQGKVMRLYRRIWSGDITASNVAIEGDKPTYRVSESAIQAYFSGRQMAVPSVRRIAGAR
jgi:hypothetical protein